MNWRASVRLGVLAAGTVPLALGCSGSSSTPPAAPVVAAAVKAGGKVTRRDVKTGLDPEASTIVRDAKDTTIEDIVSQKPPAGKLEGRVAPFETSTWRVKATLASVKLMKDGDFYLVMKGAKGGETVVEVPDPKDCKGSPLEPEIAAARKALEERYHPTKDVKELHDEATVTGVGFLGFGPPKPGSTSKGKTGARLMPGLGFEFDKKG